MKRISIHYIHYLTRPGATYRRVTINVETKCVEVQRRISEEGFPQAARGRFEKHWSKRRHVLPP